MTHWRGLLEIIRECDAETEEEAMKLLAEQLIQELQSKETEFLAWRHES